MITSSDFISLSYSTELPAAGCLYACQMLVYATDYARASRYPVIRQNARQAVIELALYRYLAQMSIPFKREIVAPFTTPGYASLVLGGRVCQMVVTATGPVNEFLDLEKINIDAPPESNLPDAHEDEELLIFAALSVPASIKVDPAEETWVYPMPESWAQPRQWASLGNIEICCGTASPVEMSLDGQDERHQMQCETVRMLPATPMRLQSHFLRRQPYG